MGKVPFMMNRFLRRIVLSCWLAATALSLGQSEFDQAPALRSVLLTLDQFMMAGKEGDPRRGANLLDRYEYSPRKVERGVDEFYEEHQELLVGYVSMSRDIYGYEIQENGYRGPNLVLEGRVETRAGFSHEFSARLVLRDQRWRILTLEID
ncbi:hypothetical protein [Pelagicoccus albus]|uniref:DUF4440 domain-containing protein n=1 Tax=Pelagicoccus albus TaxID=415222 RepID=A0A7X1E8U0_9BACT|nr:hypothetical protein [Pelagicoccus albus]MBC2606709.1 hypothetical protein [Pelagicoccus albus]